MCEMNMAWLEREVRGENSIRCGDGERGTKDKTRRVETTTTLTLRLRLTLGTGTGIEPVVS
jgi:hypothetical protein